jgi:hypothetical protein
MKMKRLIALNECCRALPSARLGYSPSGSFIKSLGASIAAKDNSSYMGPPQAFLVKD